MRASQTVIRYFLDKMNDAGYDARIGYDVPDFAKAPKDKIMCELWLTNGEAHTWENTQTALEAEDTIECYIYRYRDTVEDVNGKWYSDVDDALDALTDDAVGRTYQADLWWNDSVIDIDRASPLKRWNNSSHYSAGFLCARIDLPVKYLRDIS